MQKQSLDDNISVYLPEYFLLASVEAEIAKHSPKSSNLRQNKFFQITSLLRLHGGCNSSVGGCKSAVGLISSL